MIPSLRGNQVKISNAPQTGFKMIFQPVLQLPPNWHEARSWISWSGIRINDHKCWRVLVEREKRPPKTWQCLRLPSQGHASTPCAHQDVRPCHGKLKSKLSQVKSATGSRLQGSVPEALWALSPPTTPAVRQGPSASSQKGTQRHCPKNLLEKATVGPCYCGKIELRCNFGGLAASPRPNRIHRVIVLKWVCVSEACLT